MIDKTENLSDQLENLKIKNGQLFTYVKSMNKKIGTSNSGKPLADISEANKARKINEFKSKAETALWFAESYGLTPSYLKLQSSNGKDIKIDFKATSSSSSYQQLPNDEKQKIKDLLFILEKFNVSESAYRELTMFSDDLPRKYLIAQCRDDINNIFHFERTSGNIPGAFMSLESEIARYIKCNFDDEVDKIRVKVSGDGSKVSRISNFIVLSFSVITDNLTQWRVSPDRGQISWKTPVSRSGYCYYKKPICLPIGGILCDFWVPLQTVAGDNGFHFFLFQTIVKLKKNEFTKNLPLAFF